MMRDESEEKGTRRLCQAMARIHMFCKEADRPQGSSLRPVHLTF